MFGIMQKSVLPFVPNGDISLPEPLTLHLGMLLVQGYLCQNLWGKTLLSTLVIKQFCHCVLSIVNQNIIIRQFCILNSLNK